MARVKALTDWLETHWVNPAYGGLVLGGISLFFFIAATNTLAGWLYVLSGSGLAIVILNSYLARRDLADIQVTRIRIDPVSAGDALRVNLRLFNGALQPKFLLQGVDRLPVVLADPQSRAIAEIPPQTHWEWSYEVKTQYRGIYRWHTLDLRTAAPLGLFWFRKSFEVPAKAIVYPTVLPLSRCPIIDALGTEQTPQLQNETQPIQRSHHLVTEITRTLRPYRWGDPMRFIHWRTSARYGELRIRELEVLQGGQEILIALDAAPLWSDPEGPSLGPVVESFEQAVVAAASLYFYAQQHNIPVRLWTPSRGVVVGQFRVLETLAETLPGESLAVECPSDRALIWLSQNPDSTTSLPDGSRWLLWTNQQKSIAKGVGKYMNVTQPLQPQLQEWSM